MAFAAGFAAHAALLAQKAGFIVGDWSVEYPEPEPQGSVDWTNPNKPIVRYVFPRAAMRDKP